MPDSRLIELSYFDPGKQVRLTTCADTIIMGPDGFDDVENVTGYLNTFGATVAQRIRAQFQPLFDPASEPLSEEVLAVNDNIQAKVGYSLTEKVRH